MPLRTNASVAQASHTAKRTMGELSTELKALEKRYYRLLSRRKNLKDPRDKDILELEIGYVSKRIQSLDINITAKRNKL